ncbi:hypothetical protein OSB04_010708 [Centaurea solstitialis]|uniref:Uncharacterized protein n=1 Tax=Centaurea solstitialis TaxID=347529 RepID=A0AA38T838_9ASTR|nr:hypothetical protein OSB04_010708 [Centaurea solstitialis]
MIRVGARTSITKLGPRERNSTSETHLVYIYIYRFKIIRHQPAETTFLHLKLYNKTSAFAVKVRTFFYLQHILLQSFMKRNQPITCERIYIYIYIIIEWFKQEQNQFARMKEPCKSQVILYNARPLAPTHTPCRQVYYTRFFLFSTKSHVGLNEKHLNLRKSEEQSQPLISRVRFKC